MLCPPIRSIIRSLKLVDYLSVQADNHAVSLTKTTVVDSSQSLQAKRNKMDLVAKKAPPLAVRRQGYKTFFMLNSIEHESFRAQRC